LPALSPDWPQGRIHGLRARGGLSVDIEWRGGKATAAEIEAFRAQEFTLRPPPGQRIGRVRLVQKGKPASQVPLKAAHQGTVRVPVNAGERLAVEFA